jgi:glycosyltransferase involved in cell wall biosynthesis
MSVYHLSYIISTKNRLPFLKITLERLLSCVNDDEEIVVVDANSTDGSKEYLTQLCIEGKIHQFISEPDRNQAHGWNKAMLMARGIIIKKIIDDDVFCYQAIRQCKNYMLLNPGIDVVISNDLRSSLNNYKHIKKSSRLSQFEKWNKGHIPSFTFGDVHMIIRRSSLAYIGLYNTSFIMMDWEYSLRISYLKANITYFTGYNALSVTHAQTISSIKDIKLITEQGLKGNIFYEYAGDGADISIWSKIKIFVGKLMLRSKSQVRNFHDTSENLNAIYDYYYKYLSELNNGANFKFFN